MRTNLEHDLARLADDGCPHAADAAESELGAIGDRVEVMADIIGGAIDVAAAEARRIP